MMSIDLNDFYSQMFLIRTIESKFLEYYSKGRIKGTVHTCLGQEACAVGVLNAIDQEKDIVFSNHRAHGHFIAYGGPVQGLVSEVLGKASGICSGIGGSQHLHWKNFYTNGIQGGMVPSAVGSALAEKLKKSNAVTLVFIGDGTMGQGTVYESFNISALWKLPIIFVLENNKYAQSTPVHMAHAGKLEERATPFGINTIKEDGNDVTKVYKTACSAINYVRKHSLPVFLVLDTYRLGPHSKGDDFRPSDEIKKHQPRDPLRITAKGMPHQVKKEIEAEVLSRVEILFN
jgi:TPP-dependent pyruvate/acetoin dehydrogenase alpha subunit